MSYPQNTGLQYSARDKDGVSLVMPEALSKYICDLARVKLPECEIGENGECAICFGRRPDCNKLEGYRYCKGCYQEYTRNGTFTIKHSYTKYRRCIQCNDYKNTGYLNCPLCVRCYDIEKSSIYEFQGKDKCGCGNKKAKQFGFCFRCNNLGKYEEAKLKLSERIEHIVALFDAWCEV